MKVYLDKVRIVDGQRFDINFAKGTRQFGAAFCATSSQLLSLCWRLVLSTRRPSASGMF